MTLAMDRRDPDAFRALYAEHRPTIKRYFAARAPASQVDDLTSETFLVAWRRDADRPAHTLPWLLNVAGKVLSHQRRKTERSGDLVHRLAQVSRLDDPGVPQAAERRTEQLAVLHALATLTPGDRELMLLTIWDGLQTREVATALGVTPVAARARLSRARRRLESALRAELDSPSHPATNPTAERASA